jgi:predicted ATPase/DNA-binding CsgD family transcriptional regulator
MVTLSTYQFPAQVTPFVGRTAALAEIASLLANPVCRLVTLVGPGGIGKTRLALEALRREAPAYADGGYFVGLQAIHSPDFIIPAIAEALEFDINHCCDPDEQLLEFLSTKKLLLVLDNFEHLLEGVSLVSELLAATTDVKIIVTTRQALNLQEEWVWPVTGLDYPTAVNGGVRLDDYDALALFAQSARRVRADFALDDELADVIRICSLVEGMPLGIELAATWVGALSAAEIAREIRRNLDFLSARTRNVEPRHASMRVVLDYSWNLLSHEEQEVFKRLSVFRGSFTRQAATAVAGASLDTLSALIDESLVRRDSAGHYDLHELVRQYAERHLNASLDDSTATRDQHAGYYMELLQRLHTDLFGAAPHKAMREIEREIKNIRVAWSWAILQMLTDDLACALDSLWFFYDTRGWYREGEKLFVLAADGFRAETEPSHRLLWAKLAVRQGGLCNSLSWFDKARSLIEEGLAILREFGERQEIAFALTRLGEVAAFQEQYELALPLIQEGLEAHRAAGDPWGEAYALNWLGLMMDRYDYIERSEAIFRELNSLWGIAVVTPSRAFFALNVGALDKARDLAEQGITLSQEIGIRWGAAMSYEALAYVYLRREDYVNALGYFQQMLKIAMDTQLPRYMAIAAVGIGRALAALNEPVLATEFLAAGYRYFENIGRHPAYLELEESIPAALSDAVLARSHTIVPETAFKGLAADLEIIMRTLAQPERAPLAGNGMDLLTEREVEILGLAASGLTNRDIAEELILSTGTVKWYLSQIYSKLGVNSRTQAIARGRELGLLA